MRKLSKDVRPFPLIPHVFLKTCPLGRLPSILLALDARPIVFLARILVLADEASPVARTVLITRLLVMHRSKVLGVDSLRAQRIRGGTGGNTAAPRRISVSSKAGGAALLIEKASNEL